MMVSRSEDRSQKILVLGAYGLIGSGVVQCLQADGYDVIGMGRDIATGMRVLPSVEWIKGDLAQMGHPNDWRDVLSGISHVVNCAGALQDGPADDLDRIHHLVVQALARVCDTSDTYLIQISAVGASIDASIPFLQTKGAGDAAISASGAKHCIIRPGLVLAPRAYGGTALLRMLAAAPFFQPVALPDARVQTVSLADLSGAVAAAVRGDLPDHAEFDLVEAEAHQLGEVVTRHRAWLGFAPAKTQLAAPAWMISSVAVIADGLGYLGWRSPLRNTSISVLAAGITGDPDGATGVGLPPPDSMARSLAKMPASAEDRLFARSLLLMPLTVCVLAFFWLASGIIGLVRLPAAAETLTAVGWAPWLAGAAVFFWAVIDIVIGIAFLFRPWARRACWAAIGVSLLYLAAATLFTPFLWFDPLGPLVKILPGIILALLLRVMLENR